MLNELPKISEEEIWEKFRIGDEVAFEWIFDQYFPQLYSYARTISNDIDLNQEVIQDLFVSLWEKRRNLGSTDSIKLYLFKALRRKLIKSINYNKKTSVFDNEIFKNKLRTECYESILINTQILDEKKEQIAKVIDNLSQRQKEVIYLKFFQNKTNKEIAEILSISIESTYKLVHYALKAMRQGMEKISLIIFLLFNLSF